MTRETLQALSRKDLGDLARKRGIAGWHEMKKDELISRILRQSAGSAKVSSKAPSVNSKPLPQAKGKSSAKQAGPSSNGVHKTQKAAARETGNGSGGISSEELVERAKFDVGVPTKDLSAKTPRSLPTGYGKSHCRHGSRSILATHIKLTHQSIQRAEAALGRIGTRLGDFASHGRQRPTTPPAHRSSGQGHRDSRWLPELVHRSPATAEVVSDRCWLCLAPRQFFVLARSNVVSTPRANVSDTLDENKADIDPKQADRIIRVYGLRPEHSQQLGTQAAIRRATSPSAWLSSLSSAGSGALAPIRPASSGSNWMPN